MNALLDIALLAILLICIIIGYKKGFVRTVFGFLSFIVAFLTAKYLSPPLSAFLFEKYVRPALSDRLVEDLASIIGKGVENLNLNKLITEQPNEFINKITGYGSNVNEVSKWVETSVKSGASNVNNFVATNVVTPVSRSVSDFIAFTAVFVAALIILNIFLLILNHIVKLPGLNLINRVGGVLLGVLSGVLWAYVFVFLMSLILPYFVAQQGIDSAASVINDTIFFKWLYENSPMSLLKNFF